MFKNVSTDTFIKVALLVFMLSIAANTAYHIVTGR